MKRIISWIIAATLLLSLCACGAGTNRSASAPEGMADQTFALGCEVLEIADSYLDGSISAEDAAQQIEPYIQQFDEVESEDSSEELYNTLVQLSVESLVYNLNAIADGSYEGDDQVQSDRDVLSDYMAGIQAS